MMRRIPPLLACAVFLCSVPVMAQQGQLQIDVTGVPGSGVTNWVFSTNVPGTAELDGSVRDTSANDFNGSDTGQFPFGEDTILDPTIQNQVFDLTGNAEITIGGDTQTLAGIFLDDDGVSADDLGVRASTELPFLMGEISMWTGSATMNLDINTFALGTWLINDALGQRMFIAEEVVVNFTAVPEPTNVALVALGALGLLIHRRP